jgi:hypothetical protein
VSARSVLFAGVALLCLCVLAACAGVLGIDERELDSTAFPVSGYAGCQPGVSCDGCILPEHESACEGAPEPSAVCAQGNLGECASCVCEHCEADVAACETSRRCLDIWTCLSETRCDLLESSSTGCYRADSCRRAIDDNGGLDGAPFEQAVAIRVCAVTSSCLSCLSPEPEPAASCSPENGCQGCADCFQQCVCSGDTFSACQEFCGSDAPPSSCSQQDDCQGCTRCFETCSCNGGSFATCSSACADSCAPGDCSGCGDCVTRCECLGADPEVCAEQCQNEGPGACVEALESGADACTGCTSCFADCTCQGNAVDDCLSQCPESAPCDCSNPNQCPTAFTSCLCDEGETPASCAEDHWACQDVQEPCDLCPCDRCHEEYALCKDTPGCHGLFNCMRTFDCQGPDCFEQCGGGQEDELMFGAAEALWACTQGQSCTCDSDPLCAEQCADFSSDGVTIEACCVEGAPTRTCGLLTRKYFPSGPECLALNQPSPPDKSSEDCPSHAAPRGEPYDGACFEGCRRADGSCGYFDDITGLGCLDPDMFTDSLTLGCLLGR